MPYPGDNQPAHPVFGTNPEQQKERAKLQTVTAPGRGYTIAPEVRAEGALAGKPAPEATQQQADPEEIRKAIAEGRATPPLHVMMGEPMLQWFDYAHLPPHLQHISMHFAGLAIWITETLPRNPERTVGLRKLLEAKDCALRAYLYK